MTTNIYPILDNPIFTKVTGTAGQTQVSFNFFALRPEYVFVSINGNVLSTDYYSVSVVNNGGVVTLETPLVADDEVVVYRKTPFSMDALFSGGSNYQTSDLDATFLRIYSLIQETYDRANRSVAASLESTTPVPPINITEGNSVLVVNEDMTEIGTQQIPSLLEAEQYASDASALIDDKVEAAITAHNVAATESVSGHAAFATLQEALAGVISDKMINPSALKTIIDGLNVTQYNRVSVITGTYNSETTFILPLPSGYTEAQCRFFSIASHRINAEKSWTLGSVSRIAAQPYAVGTYIYFAIYMVIGVK